MRFGIFGLARRSLAYYWRTNIAVTLGVATAVTSLVGALLVGDSVRGSLRDLFLERLGRADYIISSAGFVREKLASDLSEQGVAACPLISLTGVVTHQESGRRSLRVQVYGIDTRFWSFHGQNREAPRNRDVFLSPSLARELGSRDGDTILMRVEKPSAVPVESLFGRKEDAARTIRLRQRGVQPEFSTQPQQGPVHAVFVPLQRLQEELEQPGRANTIMTAGADPSEALKQRFTLEDLGIKLRILKGSLSLETEGAILSDSLVEVARRTATRLGLQTASLFTYLVNSIRSGSREIPYSLVTATDLEPSGTGLELNQWAAMELGAHPGDPVTLEYYLWSPESRLLTESAQFQVSAIVPVEKADPDYAPEYPGISGSDTLSDWDPPFPMDLGRIRPKDEDYWKRYRTTPKALLPLAKGQELWQSRFGKLTSMRIVAAERESYAQALRSALDPLQSGLTVNPVRAQGLAASHGATDFGEYFIYFSFFLVTSALLLTGLFFKLGVEQRLRQIGILQASGYARARIRALFLAEGAILALAGGVLGCAGAVAYGWLILLGLRTWWVDAVGTQLLTLHVRPASILVGGAGGILTGLAVILWTLRGVWRLSPRALLAGATDVTAARPKRFIQWLGPVLALLGAAIVAAAFPGWIPPAAAFFGAGTVFVAACLCWLWAGLWHSGAKPVRGVWQLGFRNASQRPGRSILCMALIASAVFLVVAVSAFRREGESAAASEYPLMAESLLPLLTNPNAENQVPGVTFVSFRLRPGDDASCLNLYQPRNPRILGVPASFIQTHGDPWKLLESSEGIPAIADANSMTYVLHRKIGDELDLGNGKRLRLVGALNDSVFQGEILIAEQNFTRLFPNQQGFRFFLLKGPPEAAAKLEEALSDYGFDVTDTRDRLAGFHRVENTYLATFQTLGGLGLLLGTFGLAAVLLRNVLERRRELALLQAVGYNQADLSSMILAENALLLFGGIASGAVCAMVAIAPAWLARGGHLPLGPLALLLAGVVVTGMTASLLAVAAVRRSPLLATLRAE